MAVTLFSQIKIRRGNEDDLPDLTNAEFGFATDTGNVFIGAPDFPPLQGKGRGELQEEFPYKNIRIVTSSSNQADIQQYIYKSNNQHTPQTGPTPTQPVIRNYQQKFDELVYFGDFIFNTNPTDDKSTDMNRMLREVYTGTDNADRKICHISSGTYILNQTIKIPPYAKLKGEGIDRTFLSHTNPSTVTGPTHLFETVDRLFQEGPQISTNGGGLPTNIEISDMTITIPRLMDFFRLYRASNIKFTRVKFKGAGAIASTTNVILLDRLGIILDMKNFVFDECVFEDISNVVNPLSLATHIVTDIKFNNCSFNMIYNGLSVNNNNIRNITFSNSKVDNVINKFFDLLNGVNFSSFNNTYNFTNPSIVPWNVGSAFVDFSSINDKFIGINRPLVNNSSTSIVVSKNRDDIVFNNNTVSKKFREIVQGSQVGQTLQKTFALNKFSSVVLEYTIKRNSEIRMGTIKLSHNFVNPVIFENYHETGSVGVSFNVVVGMIDGTNHMILTYDSNAYPDGTIEYTYQGMMS